MTPDTSIDIEQIRGTRYGPLSSPEETQLFLDKHWPPDTQSITVDRFASLPGVPLDDRLWMLIHLVPDRVSRLSACDAAERAINRIPFAKRDPRSVAAIGVARRYADGDATDDELADAWRRARNAFDAVYHDPGILFVVKSAVHATTHTCLPSAIDAASSSILAAFSSVQYAESALDPADAVLEEMQAQLDRLVQIWTDSAAI